VKTPPVPFPSLLEPDSRLVPRTSPFLLIYGIRWKRVSCPPPPQVYPSMRRISFFFCLRQVRKRGSGFLLSPNKRIFGVQFFDSAFLTAGRAQSLFLRQDTNWAAPPRIFSPYRLIADMWTFHERRDCAPLPSFLASIRRFSFSAMAANEDLFSSLFLSLSVPSKDFVPHSAEPSKNVPPSCRSFF